MMNLQKKENDSQKGFLITLEGIEACGKSSQAKRLFKILSNKGFNPILTHEPGATKIGLKIRNILLSVKNKNINPYAELFLYLADRAQHLAEVIYPNYQKGRIIICDRYYYSTLAYQGLTRCIDLNLIDKLHSSLPLYIKPDITFLLDIPTEEAIKRISKRLNKNKRNLLTRFEKESYQFHNKVRAAYLSLQEKYPNDITIIDGTQSINKITEDIFRILINILPFS